MSFDEALVVNNEPRQDFVALDDALEVLAAYATTAKRMVSTAT